MSATRKPPPKNVAYHEAGHCVLAYQYGRGPEAASIEGDDEMAGYARLAPAPPEIEGFLKKPNMIDRNGLAWFEGEIKILLAGLLAEKIAFKRAFLPWKDLQRAGTISNLFDDLRQMDELQSEAEEELRMRWAHVERVAGALLKETTLGSERLLELLADAVDNSP